MSCRSCRLPARGIRPEAMASKFQNLNDLWNHRLAQVWTLLQSPEPQPGRKWIKLVDLVEELDWADFVSPPQGTNLLEIAAEASPAVVAGAGFVGGGVGAPPTHQTPQSTNVLGGIAQMPAAAANSASGSSKTISFTKIMPSAQLGHQMCMRHGCWDRRKCLCLFDGPCCQRGSSVCFNDGLSGWYGTGSSIYSSSKHVSSATKNIGRLCNFFCGRCTNPSTYKSRSCNTYGRRLCRNHLRNCQVCLGHCVSPIQLLDQVNQRIPLPFRGLGGVQNGSNLCLAVVTQIFNVLDKACHCR